MGYGFWGKTREADARIFCEKAYQRVHLAAWDGKWQGLSVQARFIFLNLVKIPVRNPGVRDKPPATPAESFPAGVLRELAEAGFVKVLPAASKTITARVVASDGLFDFGARMRTLRKMHLLSEGLPSEFAKYVSYAFYNDGVTIVLGGVLRHAGIEDFPSLEESLDRYVTHHRWPGWAARSLKNPLAERIVKVLREAGGPIPLAELAGRLKGSDPDKVRLALDLLVSHLALVEDLHPQTWELMVGFLPAVRAELTNADQPRQRPPLVAVDRPKEVGPDGSMIVNDLRAVLLEVVSEPPRLRQDKALFHKEIERFRVILEPLAGWISQALKWTDELRLNQALGWAYALGLIKQVSESKTLRLHLTPKGSQWLSSGLDEQYMDVFGVLTSPATNNERFDPRLRWFFPGVDPFDNHGPDDTRFLGVPLSVLTLENRKRSPYYWDARPEDRAALRTSIDRALATLKRGVFYRLDSVVSHLTFGEHNPLNLGRAPEKVSVFWHNRPVPPLEEQREEAARLMLDGLVRLRLIPLGCVRAAIDDEGRLAIAVEPRHDAYFGREVAPSDLAPGSTGEARVVVQPDFSVIVIGLNPAPAAELAPFCERTPQKGSHGAMILKVTRESVVKAVNHGLKPAEIVARLTRHASNDVPANVLREVKEWANWVRQVSCSTLFILRCPDRDTADRVMAALKRQAERLNDTLIAIDQKTLTAADRNKLQSQGIIVKANSEARPPKAKPKKPGR